MNGNFDIDLDFGQIYEEKIRKIFQGKGGIEVKTERDMWKRTGNIAIEVSYRGSPSGLSSTNADWWVHILSDNGEIDTAFMRTTWQWEEIKPQVHKVYRDRDANDHLLLLAEGRLVNLGNATGHPSRIMDGSFANQVLAQIDLYSKKFASQDSATQAEMLRVEVLPKHLDEEVARHMVAGFGGVITKLTQEQADYIGVPVNGPFKGDSYKY